MLFGDGIIKEKYCIQRRISLFFFFFFFFFCFFWLQTVLIYIKSMNEREIDLSFTRKFCFNLLALSLVPKVGNIWSAGQETENQPKIFPRHSTSFLHMYSVTFFFLFHPLFFNSLSFSFLISTFHCVPTLISLYFFSCAGVVEYAKQISAES